MGKLKKKAALLDPSNPGALAWNVMPPETLDKVMKAAGLRRKNSLFSDEVFKSLYDTMAAAYEAKQTEVICNSMARTH